LKGKVQLKTLEKIYERVRRVENVKCLIFRIVGEKAFLEDYPSTIKLAKSEEKEGSREFVFEGTLRALKKGCASDAIRGEDSTEAERPNRKTQ